MSAGAAPFGALKQYKVPTSDSQPRDIANGSDGNRWFTESSEFVPPTIGRITPTGAVTEFRPACPFCILTDIAQGPGGILYYTSNDPILGRITTSGEFLEAVPMPNTNALAGNLAVHGNQIWITDFNNDSLWRYDIVSGQFTQFPVSEPHDVAVDAAGIVWFTAPLDSAIGRLDPQTGAVTLTPTEGFPRQIAVAADGAIWFTERFTPQAVGRLDPATNAMTEFPLTVSARRASRRRPTDPCGSPRRPRATSPASPTTASSASPRSSRARSRSGSPSMPTATRGTR